MRITLRRWIAREHGWESPERCRAMIMVEPWVGLCGLQRNQILTYMFEWCDTKWELVYVVAKRGPIWQPTVSRRQTLRISVVLFCPVHEPRWRPMEIANKTAITGRTMLRLAKEVLTNCKKMQALDMSRQSPYKDFHSFPSGTNYNDYLKWCLTAMFLSEEGAIGKSHGCLFCHQNDCCQSNQLTSTTIVPLQVPISIITTQPIGS